MSENLDLVRSIYDRWSQGDFTDASWADPEIELVMYGGLNEGSWKGVEEMTKVWSEMLRSWDGLKAVAEEIHELDDGRILVFLLNEGRGKGSGIELDGISARSANVFEIEGGKVTSLTLYWDRDRALADLGLAEAP